MRLGTRDTDVMRGQAVMGHSRHTGVEGADRWLQWPWAGQDAQAPPHQTPTPLEMPGAQVWEQAVSPKRHKSLQENWFSPKVPGL